MGNAFNAVIKLLNLTSDAQGDAGWLYALFTYAAAETQGSNTYANVATEVLRRLEARSIGAHTLAKVRAMLNTLETKLGS